MKTSPQCTFLEEFFVNILECISAGNWKGKDVENCKRNNVVEDAKVKGTIGEEIICRREDVIKNAKTRFSKNFAVTNNYNSRITTKNTKPTIVVDL